MKKQKELHLFIIWEKGRQFEKEVISEIEKEFTIAQTFSITWSPYQVANNYTRFYGASLPKGSRKELHCGIGEFRLIVVHDLKPKYDLRQTSKGMRKVNTNMFDTKAKVRELTGGGHKIHGTDNFEETKHDLVLLTGMSVDDFLVKHDKRNHDIIMKKNLMGCYGWDDFEQLFYVLNECTDYLILRNHENINIEYFRNNRSDIDILTKDSNEIKYVLGDLVNLENGNEHMHVSIDNKLVMFEVYQSGKNLYHSSFENDLFRNKVTTNEIYHPNKEMEMYALIYHALLLKKEFLEKHKARISQKYGNYIKANENNEENLLAMLIDYYKEKDYKFIMPDVGYFNLRPEIKGQLIVNNNRDGFVKKVFKKTIYAKLSRRHLDIKLLQMMSIKFYLKTKVLNRFEFTFKIGR